MTNNITDIIYFLATSNNLTTNQRKAIAAYIINTVSVEAK